jgi:DNA mismatch repair protein MutS2
MLFEPKDVLQKIEFDKIIELLEKEALNPIAAEVLRQLKPGVTFSEIDLRLREVREYKLALEKNDRFPMNAYSDVRPELRMLQIEGYTLQAESFQNVLRILYTMRDLFRFFGGVKKEIYPKLFDIIRPLSYDEGLAAAINTVFDEKGDMRPDASPELLRIRRETQHRMRDLDARFRQIIQEYRQNGWLSDNPESFRNNRRVLSVPAEHKRKMRGIIHDESETGRTVFIEPEAVIDINNDIFNLEQEERREIFRILKNLSDTIRPYAGLIRQYLMALVQYDIIQAKAKLAVSMRAGMPVLKESPIISVKKGYHPLLYLKNKALGRKTVPFELRLNGENHILILSGPNAGGKSVAMKSVGLMQIMVQSGLLVPCHELSEFGIFQQLFADIGDQQSLEDDLSTYSSRLQNAREFIKKATPKTLVLIDEMGSGTDPKPGGAIAESVLRDLHRKGVFAVITTHYSNLKVFAFRNPGILNGNMHFDKDTLSPTYELRVGRPGSSYAFEIAAKSGLPKPLIDYARSRTGSETAVDDILIELQREKQELEEHLKATREKQESLDKLIKNYEAMNQELEMKRKRLKLDQKEFDLLQKAQTNHEVDKLIRELKESNNVERAREVSVRLRAERAEKAKAVDEAYSEVLQLETGNATLVAVPFKVGDYVRLRTGGAVGRIDRLEGQKASVSLGQLQVSVVLRDLVAVAEPAKSTQNRAQTDLQRAAAFDHKIDLRGLSKEEALQTLEKFVDNALLSNSTTLHILHGKGDGILRKLVRQKLKEYGGNIASVYHPANDAGGNGITMVDLV